MEKMLEDKKPSFFYKILKKIMISLFPGVVILPTNKLLKIAGEVDLITVKKGTVIQNPYFKKQRMKNWIVSIIISLPFILSIFAGYKYMTFNPIFNKAKTAATIQLKKMKVMEAWKKITIAKKIDPNLGEDVKTGFMIMLGGIVISMTFGQIIIKKHFLIRDSILLKKALIDQGIIKRDEEESAIVLATPAGYLIKLTSNTPRDIEENQRIWMSLNTKVRGYAQHQTELSFVFFKNAYHLKKGDEYGFNVPEDPSKKKDKKNT